MDTSMQCVAMPASKQLTQQMERFFSDFKTQTGAAKGAELVTLTSNIALAAQLDTLAMSNFIRVKTSP